MKKIYKVLLVLLVILVALSFYGLNWEAGIFHEENTKYIFSVASGIIGMVLIFVLDVWSRISTKKN